MGLHQYAVKNSLKIGVSEGLSGPFFFPHIIKVGTLIKVGKYCVVGMVEVAKVDSKGRVLIPKSMRERSELFEGTLVKIEADDGKIIIEPMDSIADKYYGVFKVDEVPEDLDEFLPEVQAKLWKERHT